MKLTAIYASALTLMGTAALAQSKPGVPSVPEIDALSGFAAVAVVGAVTIINFDRSNLSGPVKRCK